MSLPVTPRAQQIAEDLLADARAFLAEQGTDLSSRQVEALARSVARHLAALEDLMLCGWPQREEVLRAGTALSPEPPIAFTVVPLEEMAPWPAPLTAAEREWVKGPALPTPLHDPAATRWTPSGFVREEHVPCEGAPFPTTRRDVALGLEEPRGPLGEKPDCNRPNTWPRDKPQPRMLIVQRWDRGEPENVSEGSVRWGQDQTIAYGHGTPTLAWSLCAEAPTERRVPYIRESPDSPWGVRVEILGEGR